MGPTTRAQFVYNRRRRRRRSGGRRVLEEASDEEEQRQDTSSSSSDDEGDEEEEAEASGEEVDDDDYEEVEEEAAAAEPAAKERPAPAAAGEKRGGRKGPITISLKKVCKVLARAMNLKIFLLFPLVFLLCHSICVRKDDPCWCLESNLVWERILFSAFSVVEHKLPLVLDAKWDLGISPNS